MGENADGRAPVALITGGSRGIGAATARLAAQRGYDVCISYERDERAAAEIVGHCRQIGRRAAAQRCDVAETADVEALFAHVDRTFGRLDLLVNNAGIVGGQTRVADLTDDALRRTFAVNVFGTITCARAAVRRMSRSLGGDGGVIINLSSIAATLGSPGEYVHYAASKGAVESFTIGLAKEVGREGIRVNALRAGTIATDIHARSGNPDRPTEVAKISPLGRVGTPDEMAEAILFLASDAAGFATGSIMTMSGGVG